MTKPDFDDLDAGPSDGAILLKRAVLGIGGGALLLFIVSMIGGYSVAAIKRGGPDLADAGMLGGMALVAALVGYGVWRFWPSGAGEPVAQRVRSARLLLASAIVLGVPLGILLAANDEGTGTILSNAPVGPGIAALAIVLWAIAGPLISWLWWQKIDEHEADAYRDGALVSAHAYIYVVPAWWMATRAGWLAPQDPMLVMLVVTFLWSAVWFVRRYL